MKSKLFKITVLIFLGGISVFSWSVASAHHSTTVYDYTIHKVMTGTVVRFRWTQPHSFVILNVPTEDGGVEEWNVEVGTPSVNARMGWKKSDINAGDVITMTVHPVRTGKPHGSSSVVVLADGRTLYGPGAGLAGNGPAPLGGPPPEGPAPQGLPPAGPPPSE